MECNQYVLVLFSVPCSWVLKAASCVQYSCKVSLSPPHVFFLWLIEATCLVFRLCDIQWKLVLATSRLKKLEMNHSKEPKELYSSKEKRKGGGGGGVEQVRSGRISTVDCTERCCCGGHKQCGQQMHSTELLQMILVIQKHAAPSNLSGRCIFCRHALSIVTIADRLWFVIRTTVLCGCGFRSLVLLKLCECVEAWRAQCHHRKPRERHHRLYYVRCATCSIQCARQYRHVAVQ